MTYPNVTAVTTGLRLVMQVTLAFAVSGNRSKANTWVGDGGNAGLLQTPGRHANSAENAGIFLIGMALFEPSHFRPRLLMALGPSLIGLAPAVALVWVGLAAAGRVIP